MSDTPDHYKYDTGDVVIIKNPSTDTERKEKRAVIVCPDNQWYFLINSEQTKASKGPKIKAQDYSFLKRKDRFICCTDVFPYNYDRRKDRVDGNEPLAKLRGLDLLNLSAYLKKKYKGTARKQKKATRIKRKHKRVIIKNIESQIKKAPW